MFFAGIDTSCYTTSFAVVDESGQVVYDNRKLLRVPEGSKGLRQSEIVFEHVKNFPEVCGFYKEVAAVAYSEKPTGRQGSYMPVFMVSRALAYAMCEKKYALTHQTGHIGAALIGGEGLEGDILAVHVSGGTTELLKVRIMNGIVLDVDKLGGTLDIAAGQLIDRVGHKLGLPFPCGPHLEQRAQGGTPFSIKTSVSGLDVNFSGAETFLLRSEHAPEDIAATAQCVVARSLLELVKNAQCETGLRQTLMFGGVMCNAYIRDYLKNEIDVLFAGKEYASDNACGLANQARLIYLEEKNG